MSVESVTNILTQVLTGEIDLDTVEVIRDFLLAGIDVTTIMA